MKISQKRLLFFTMLLITMAFEVDSYCAPGTDTKLDVIKPLNSNKLKVAADKETTLEVRYKGTPQVRWHIGGKEIALSSKSKHFEFIKSGTDLKVGSILKIKNFKKQLAGDYKITINNAGCVNSKVIKVELDKSFNLQSHIDVILKKVPYLKTKSGICLLLVGFAFCFIIIPCMVCCAMCLKIRKMKKELASEKGRMEIYFENETRKKSRKSKEGRKKSHKKEKRPLLSSSSDDLPSARPTKKK